MLLGLTYEEVESAFGGPIDPSKGQDEASRFQEAFRLQEAFRPLLLKSTVVACSSCPTCLQLLKGVVTG